MEIRRGFSSEPDANLAAHEFHAAVAQPEMELVVFYCSADYDLERLAGAMNQLFAGVEVVGCTASGLITPQGLLPRGLVGVSLSGAVCRAVSGYVGGLKEFVDADGSALAGRLLFELEERSGVKDADPSFALVLVDGLSMREGRVARAFQSVLGATPMVGGSASGSRNGSRTWVFAGGSFRQDAAALALVSTPLEVAAFKTQHLEPTEKRMVITAADPEQRRVREIDGMPAAKAYARQLGMEVEELTSGIFAASPLVVHIGDDIYVRSIQRVNEDLSLTFFSAVEEGLVLRLARSCEMAESLGSCFARIRERLGAPQLVLAFDCTLRWSEIEQCGLKRSIEQLDRAQGCIGLCTYGEIFQGIHVNQTLTGIALGEKRSRGLHG